MRIREVKSRGCIWVRPNLVDRVGVLVFVFMYSTGVDREREREENLQLPNSDAMSNTNDRFRHIIFILVDHVEQVSTVVEP